MSSTTPTTGHKDIPCLDRVRGISGRRPENKSCRVVLSSTITALYCTLPYFTVLYCIILYHIVLSCCTVFYCPAVLYCCTVLYCTVMHHIDIVLYFTVLTSTVLYYTVLYCRKGGIELVRYPVST